MNANHSRVRDIFDRFDTDGNGTLSEAEFLMGLGSIGLHLTPQEMHMTLEGITDDGDDGVSYEELKTYVTPSPPPFREPFLLFLPSKKPKSALGHGHGPVALYKSAAMDRRKVARKVCAMHMRCPRQPLLRDA